MRRIVSTLAAAGVAAFFSSVALAQMNTGGTRSSGITVPPTETVVSVRRDTNQLVLRDAMGAQRTIMLDNGTTIERQALPGTRATTMQAGEITAGDRVMVDALSRSDGFTAQRIQVLSPAVGAGPPGSVRPGANPAIPGGGAGANPASPPGTVRPGANPASPPHGGAGANPAAPF